MLGEYLVKDPQRPLGMLGAFHVDSHEGSELFRVLDDTQDIPEAEFLVDVEAELCEFERDRRDSVARFDFIQARPVGRRRRLRLLALVDALSEQIERDSESGVIQRPRRGERLGGGLAGHEPPRRLSGIRHLHEDVLEVLALTQEQQGLS